MSCMSIMLTSIRTRILYLHSFLFLIMVFFYSFWCFKIFLNSSISIYHVVWCVCIYIYFCYLLFQKQLLFRLYVVILLFICVAIAMIDLYFNLFCTSIAPVVYYWNYDDENSIEQKQQKYGIIFWHYMVCLASYVVWKVQGSQHSNIQQFLSNDT